MDFTARPLLLEVWKDGECVYNFPAVEDIRAYAEQNVSALWDEYKRILNPEQYPVDLSQALYDEKMRSIKEIRDKVDNHVLEIEEELSKDGE